MPKLCTAWHTQYYYENGTVSFIDFVHVQSIAMVTSFIGSSKRSYICETKLRCFMTAVVY